MAFDKDAYNRWYYQTHKYLWDKASGYANSAKSVASTAKSSAKENADDFVSSISNGKITSVNQNTIQDALSYAQQVLNSSSYSESAKKQAQQFINNNKDALNSFVRDNASTVLRGVANNAAQSVMDDYYRERNRIKGKVDRVVGKVTKPAKAAASYVKKKASKATSLISKYPEYYAKTAKRVAARAGNTAKSAAKSYASAYRSGLSDIRSGVKSAKKKATKLYNRGAKTVTKAANKAKKKVTGFLKKLGW